MSALTADLSAAISERLAGVSRKDMARRTAAISRHYRGCGGSTLIRSSDDALAYTLARMPATYAAISAALREAAALAEIAPKTLIDVACGPGTASFAGAAHWPGLERVILVDSNAAFLNIATCLAARSAAPALRDATYKLAGIETAIETLPRVDAVILSYALVEMPEARLAALARQLWGFAGSLLVLVEPGTPEGFRRIRVARDALIATGAQLVAPCSHAERCPMPAPDWCHFSQRLPRSRDHMAAKSATVAYEDEKFSYVVIGRAPARAISGRVIRRPRRNKATVTLDLCTADGIIRQVVARRARKDFVRYRRAAWGDAVIEPLGGGVW